MGPAFAAGDGPRPAPAIEVELEAGLLTLRADKAPLADVLRAIAEKAGVEPVLRGDLEAPVSQTFGPVPLEAGIRQLVGGNTLIMIHAAPGGGDATPRLTHLRVYGAGASAERAAGGAPPSGPVDRIERDLAGSNPAHRGRAVQRAAGLEPDVALDILGQVLVEDEDQTVRLQAAAVLGDFGGDSAAERLEAGLSDANPVVRAEVVRALGRAGGQRAVLALSQVLLGSKDAELRQIAIAALAQDKGEAVTAVLRTAAEDRDHRVSAAAREALAGR